MCMNKKLMIPAIILIILLNTGAIALAHNGNSPQNDKAKFELRVNNEAENEVNVNQNFGRVEIKEEEFEIRGEITSVSGNIFMVMGQTINIDPSKVNEFKQKGLIQTGKMVKVEGIIQGGAKFATEINVIGTGQGRFKFEVEGLELTTTPTGIITPTPTGTITPTPTGTQSAEISSNANVKVKAKGPIEDVLEFLKQITAFLQGLI